MSSSVDSSVGLPVDLVVLHLDDPSVSVSVIVDVSTPVPTIVHWGASVGSAISDVRATVGHPVSHGALDILAPLSIVPEHGSGFQGRPGLEGARPDGRGWAPRFAVGTVEHTPTTLACTSVDETEGLTLRTEMELLTSGVLRVRTILRNEAPESYRLDALRVVLPVPARAQEALTFGGRWTKEFQPIRQPLHTGSISVENRSGRSSHNRTPIVMLGTTSFTESTGEVWAAHLEWSGNSNMVLDSSTDRRKSIQVEELLFANEITLATGESYGTPWVACAYSDAGLNGISRCFHNELRSRPNHPSSSRPVTLNIWEAVYFDHDLDTLKTLANAASEIGVERFVIDDGWFHGRRNDLAGLGDWWVDASVWPNGLSPIADHVRALGMEFGLWFEPEMVNPNSDLCRTHPDWVLTDQRYEPVLGRNQLVLDLSNAEVREYLYEKIDAILTAYPIAYVKWDNNREYVHASHNGAAVVHQQTLGTYDLLDRLRAAHPTVEFESCASGGGRIDFGILQRAERVWTSDCNDPLERQRIQRGFSYVFPPEYMGSHIGPPRSHTTHRTHSLAFRAGTAFFGHLGIEWNILEATDDERKSLANVIELHKRFRPLLHGGDVMRFDHANDAILAHGVIAADKSEALISFVQMDSAESLIVEPLLVPGLDPLRRYRVEALPIVELPTGASKKAPGWMSSGAEITGRQLAVMGLQPPILHPESALIIHVKGL
jgi:alpha-galactosidase